MRTAFGRFMGPVLQAIFTLLFMVILLKFIMRLGIFRPVET